MQKIATLLISLITSLSFVKGCIGIDYPEYIIEDQQVWFVTYDFCVKKIESKKLVSGVNIEDVKFSNSSDSFGYFIAHDRNKLFCNGNEIRGVIPSAVNKVNSEYTYIRDFFTAGSNVYMNCKLIENLDGSSLEIVYEDKDNIYLKDINSVFFNNDIIEGINSHSFQLLNKYYSTDGDYVLYDGIPMKGVNASSFEVIPSRPSFGKDSQNIFFEGNKMYGFGPHEFNQQQIETIFSLNRNFDKNKNLVFDVTENNTEKKLMDKVCEFWNHIRSLFKFFNWSKSN